MKRDAGYKKNGTPPLRIYTDVSGENYWTVVSEQDVRSLDEMADLSRKMMSDPKVSAAMKDYHDLVNDGRREFQLLILNVGRRSIRNAVSLEIR